MDIFLLVFYFNHYDINGYFVIPNSLFPCLLNLTKITASPLPFIMTTPKMLGNLFFYFCSYPFVPLFNQFMWSKWMLHLMLISICFKWIGAIWIFHNGKCLNSYLGYDCISDICNLHVSQFCICSSCNVFSTWFLTWNVCIYTSVLLLVCSFVYPQVTMLKCLRLYISGILLLLFCSYKCAITA